MFKKDWKRGKGKLTSPFSAQHQQISDPRLISAPPCLLALPTEAEIRIRSAENGYVDLPGPLEKLLFCLNKIGKAIIVKVHQKQVCLVVLTCR